MRLRVGHGAGTGDTHTCCHTHLCLVTALSTPVAAGGAVEAPLGPLSPQLKSLCR